MITPDRITHDITANWFAFVLVFVIMGRYGGKVIEWFLMKLYEFFIQRNPVSL